MPDWNAIQAFMAKVVPWPASQHDAGWVNMHFSFPNRDNPKELIKKGGWPLRSLEGFISRVNFALTTPARYKDVWYCTSLQSEAGKNSAGKPKAIRKKMNALGLNSIWVDIDVGPDEPGKPPKYHTIEEALRAVIEFQLKVGLPAPSAIVFSGGGIHVYWISKTTLTPQEWHPYADGLKQLLLMNGIKCDAGLTTDSARILRVPGTLNYKYDPPKPVELAPGPLRLYDFEAKLGLLKGFAGPATAAAPVQGPALWAEGVTRASFGAPNPAFDALKSEPGLDAGIDKHQDFKLDPRPIFTKCGFYRDALKTGGASYNQPLWMLSVLGTTFMENGDGIAHKISSGHVTYSEADTQAMYDRKVAERSASGIGYPSCSAIAGSGCQACKTCPLFAQGKSPLNIKPDPPKVTATVTPNVQSQHAMDQCIPEGFDFNADGIICKLIEKEDEGETTTTLTPLFQAVISNFWLQKEPGENINFDITMDKGHSGQVSVAIGEVGAQGFTSYLLKKRILIDTRGERYLKEFFLSTIGKLRALAAAQNAVPFGWYLDASGVRRGFSYDGVIHLDDGSKRPCGHVDQNIQRSYRPKGTLANWQKAAACILNRERPDLTCIILTAFAAPLMGLTDHNSMMMSACAKDSGAGKSACVKLGLSVWGDPLATKGTPRQTENNVTTIMKTIRNLPFYWDEISGKANMDKIRYLMMEADGGKEKGRNLSGVDTQEVGTWQLMLSFTANKSLRENIQQNEKDTSAKLMRVLEWDVPRIDGGPGFMSRPDADALIALTRTNHGVMGQLYAEYIALHHVRIQQEVLETSKRLETLLSAAGDERLWVNGIALMICAAGYARECGLNIDPAMIEDFLIKTYKINRADRDTFAAGGIVDNSEDLLTGYLKQRQASQQGLWTSYMHNKQGKPAKPVLVLKGPQTQMNMKGGIQFRCAVANKQLIIGRDDFDGWINEKEVSLSYTHVALRKTFGMEIQYLQLGAGTTYDTGREKCLVLNITRSSTLWEFLTMYSSPEDRAKLEAGEEAPTVNTGFNIDPTTGLATPESVIAFVQGATGA